MARQIVIYPEPSTDSTSWVVNGVFWLPAPANNQRPLAAITSAIPPASVDARGVSGAEQTALQSGAVVEVPFGPITYSTVGVGNVPNLVAADLVARLNAAKAALASSRPAGKFIFSSYDGTTWTVGP